MTVWQRVKLHEWTEGISVAGKSTAISPCFRYSAASQWFCNGSVYTEPSEIHTNGSVMVLYGSVMVL